jgi:hypothetical protein
MDIRSRVASRLSVGPGGVVLGLALTLFVLPGQAQQGLRPGAAPRQPTPTPQVVTSPGSASDSRAPATSTPVMSGFQFGMLTLHVKEQPLRSILQEISRMTGVSISVAEGLADTRLSFSLEQFRLDEALRQILNGYDTFFLYGVDDVQVGASTLKAVWVYPANQGKALRPGSPIPTSAWTASTLEFQQMMSDPDPKVRARAIDAVIRRTGRESAEAVESILKNADEKDNVRITALNRALTSGVQIPQEVLINLALHDDSVNIRYLALQALPVDPRLRWVADRALQDESSYVNKEAQAILDELDSSAAPAVGPNQRP